MTATVLNRRTIDGNVPKHGRSLAFTKRNLHYSQRQQRFSILGELEMPEKVFE